MTHSKSLEFNFPNKWQVQPLFMYTLPAHFEPLLFSCLFYRSIFLNHFPAPNLLLSTVLTSKASFTSWFFKTQLWGNWFPSYSPSRSFHHQRRKPKLPSCVFSRLPLHATPLPLFHNKMGTKHTARLWILEYTPPSSSLWAFALSFSGGGWGGGWFYRISELGAPEWPRGKSSIALLTIIKKDKWRQQRTILTHKIDQN